ncbi:MAG: tetratricopeptide repeat protein [bacterium]
MKKIFLSAVLVSLFISCFAIEDLDGFYKVLEEVRFYVGENKLDSADIRIAEMKDFLKAGKYSEETDEYGNYYYAIGVRQINSDKEKEAKDNLQKCIDIFKKIYGEKNEIMFHVYRNIGKECVFAEKSDLAIEYFKNSDLIFNEAEIEIDVSYGELKYFQARTS